MYAGERVRFKRDNRGRPCARKKYFRASCQSVAGMGEREGVFVVMAERDLELEEDCPGLRECPYAITSPRDPQYNCVAFAVGDTSQWWDDIRIKGYYWPPGAPGADTLLGWVKVFEIHGYQETEDRSLESEYEKVAIYASADGPEHPSSGQIPPAMDRDQGI